ncbi:MAG: hypothetical protein M0Q87_15250 [Ottowia sp.]|nr:hypothetical protein [Ottowia sp.]
MLNKLIAHRNQIKEHPLLTTFLKDNKFIPYDLIDDNLEYYKIHFKNEKDDRSLLFIRPIIKEDGYSLEVYIEVATHNNKEYKIATKVNSLSKEELKETMDELILLKHAIKDKVINLN